MLDTPKLIIGAILTAILLAAVISGVTTVNGWRDAALREPALKESLADAQATIELQNMGAERAKEVSRAYQADLTAIRAERDRLRALPPRVVRVYVPGPAIAVPSPVAGGRPRAIAPGAVALTGQAGQGPRLSRDIGPELYGIVDDCDTREAELARQVTGLQQAYGVAVEACGASK